MDRKYILYNALSGNGNTYEKINLLKEHYDSEAHIIDIGDISDYNAFFTKLTPEDDIIICGGDGTLNRFVNDIGGKLPENKIYYYPIGNGNDFARDIGKESGTFPSFSINEYLENLPVVTVNGKDYFFINGIGYGIDGYCCEEGDKIRQKNMSTGKHKKINYSAIAIKGLLFHFRPRRATVTVDGEEYVFDKVWISPVMKGRYYGGGMNPAPNQNRLSDDGKLSVAIIHGSGRLRTLMIFPSIFDGTHIKHDKYVTVLTGSEISVSFDEPSPLQIDGETLPSVSRFCARSKIPSKIK